jgi:hypothetical protein
VANTLAAASLVPAWHGFGKVEMTKMTGRNHKCLLAVLRVDLVIDFEIDFEVHFEEDFGKKMLTLIFH